MIALSRHALRRGFIWTLVAAIWLTLQSGPLSAATFTDSAGRQVEIPAKIERVMAAGPPAALLLYSLAPDKLIGWPHALDGRTAALLPQRYALLPVAGRITGHGNTPSAEAIAALHPDIMIDVGDVEPEYAALADRIQQQTHIPYILLDGRLANTAAIYRLLGPLLEERDKGEELAAYADRVLVLLKTKTKGGMPRLYYARGADGLSTGAVTSLTGEIIGFANAVNVAPGEKSTMKASLDQIAGWNPDVILAHDPAAYQRVTTDSAWTGLRAAKDKRVYLAPQAPFGWIDEPPGINRLLGVQWLAITLHPDAGLGDIRAIAADFCRRFYHANLSEAQIATLLAP